MIRALLTADTLVQDLAAVILETPAAAALRQGRTVEISLRAQPDGRREDAVVRQEKSFLGLGEVTARGEIVPSGSKILGKGRAATDLYEMKRAVVKSYLEPDYTFSFRRMLSVTSLPIPR